MIGRWALKAACGHVRTWQRRGLRSPPVAVNISTAQLKHPDFVDTVGDVLAETGLDPRLLELEITESMVMDQSESLVSRLTELKAFGIGLAIDDFGTGYSNLGYLKSFPLDRLKIDRSFVSGLPDDPNAVSIVRAILAMSNGLGLEVIAEGVETAEQARMLAELGCELAQGFYYCAPLPADSIEARLRQRDTRVA
jgi:EAL domain-containing protein (putative c-di-GMP-specific phosphodiesterase class I)